VLQAPAGQLARVVAAHAESAGATRAPAAGSAEDTTHSRS